MLCLMATWPGVGLELVPALCPLCGVEDGNPIAVGEDFEYRTSSDTFLMLRCRGCRVLYLNPRPADDEAGRIYPANYHAFQFNESEYGIIHTVRRSLELSRLRSWCQGLPRDARILDVGCGDGFHLDLLHTMNPRWRLEGLDTDGRAVAAAQRRGLDARLGRIEDLADAASYDLILLIMTIEHLTDPVAVLRTIRSRLRPGGRLGVITDNAQSPDAALFRGRHWGGYHFPRHTVLFDRRTLAKAAAQAGLKVERIRTSFSPVNWTYSIRNLLDDWGAPPWLVRQFSLTSAPALAAFTLLDVPLAIFGCGAILIGSFRREEP